MNDIFMNFASILSLSGKTGGIQSSIAGCSQELRNIALGLELGNGGESIKEALGILSNQCDEESQKVSRMGSTLHQAAQIMRSTEDRVIQNNFITVSQNAIKSRYKNALKETAVLGIAGGGIKSGTGYGGDPVSMFSGNFLWQITPFKTYAGETFELTIYYDTAYKGDTGLGRGFRHNFMSCIKPMGDCIFGIFDADGNSNIFLEGEDHIFYPQNPTVKRLYREDNGFRYYDPELLHSLKYDKDGRLRAEYIKEKEIKRLIYDGEHLIKVESLNGYFFDFAYEDNHLVKITDNIGRYIKFKYMQDLLSEMEICLEAESLFTHLYDCRKYSYFYDDRAHLVKITDPDEKMLFENIYDEIGRVVHQSMGEGRFFTFTYNGNKTLNCDETGFTTEYIHDENGNLLLMKNPLLKYEAEYDKYNRITKKTVNETDTMQYHYNAFGQLSAVIKGGFFHEFFYDENHKLSEYTFNGKSYLKIHYDLAGNVISMDYPGEKPHQFFYDENNRLTGYEAYGESCRLCYNEKGFIVRLYAPEELSEEYGYDSLGRIINIKIENEREINIRYAFDDLIGCMWDNSDININCKYSLTGKMLSYKSGEKKTNYVYDNFGNITELHLPGEDVYIMEYNACGNLLNRYRGDFLVESLSYDENQRVVNITDGLGYEEYYTWNIWNQPISIKNSNGLNIRIDYDENHLIKAISMNDFHLGYQYDSNGRLASVFDDEGRYIIYDYDMADRVVQVNTFQSRIEISYDNFSNITLISPADFGYLLQNKYDEYNRLIESKTLGKPLYQLSYSASDVSGLKIEGRTASLKYDRTGHMMTFSNQLGKETVQKFDQYNRLLSVGTKDLPNIIRYGYDISGRIKWLRDEKMTVLFSYDGLKNLSGIYYLTSGEYSDEELNLSDGEWAMKKSDSYCLIDTDYDKRLISLKDSSGNSEIFETGPSGNLKNIHYAGGDSKEIIYDSLLRVKKIFERGSYNENSSFVYDKDWITKATNSKGNVRFDYDLGGRVTGIHYPDGSIAGYEWNQANLCTAILYPDGNRVEYSYDSFGNLTKANLLDDILYYSYDEKHRLVKKQSNSFIQNLIYHENGKLKTLSVQDDAGVLMEIQYNYDEFYNRLIEKTIFDRDREILSYDYAYDKRGLLAKTWKNGELFGEYKYDAFGNIIYSKESKEEARYTYNAQNQLLQKDFMGQIYSYEYNARGDLICELLDGKILSTYQYNGLGQLLYAVNEKGSVQYSYDALGNRIEAEYTYKNLKKEKEIYYPGYLTENGLPLCKRSIEKNISQNFYFDQSPLAESLDGKPVWNIYDDDQNPILRLKDENNYEISDYSPFGVCKKYQRGESFQLFSTEYGFNSHIYDDFLNRHITYNRVYDPKNGRFHSKDICIGDFKDPLSFNRYIYKSKNFKNIFTNINLANDLAKDFVVAKSFIISNIAIEAVSKSPLNILSTLNYNKSTKEAVTACLNPLCGGLEDILQKNIKFSAGLGNSNFNCNEDIRPFFFKESALFLGGCIPAYAFGKSGENIYKGFYSLTKSSSLPDIQKKIKKSFCSPAGKLLPALIAMSNKQMLLRTLNQNVSKEMFFGLANKNNNNGIQTIIKGFKKPAVPTNNFTIGAVRLRAGIGACTNNPV